MAIIDNIKDRITSVIPQKRESLPVPGSSGVGHNVYRGEDLILTRTFIVATSFQIFLAFIAMCCFAGVASFQAKYKVGPSGLSILAIFDSLVLLFLASFLLAVPVIYDKYDRLRGVARALRVIRVAAICNGIGIFFSFITAFITTISVFTQAGCKDAKKDPSAHDAGKDFVNGLPGWCVTKRAGAFFFWFTMIAWLVTAYLTLQEWRTGKTVYRPEDPPFSLPMSHPHATEENADPYTEDDSPTHSPRDNPFNNNNNNQYADRDEQYDGGYRNTAGRPSMDAYGAFSGPEPTGYGRGAYTQTPPHPEVSRTMQYADPYAAVTASIRNNGEATPPYTPYQR